jgi:hypothetical protein
MEKFNLLWIPKMLSSYFRPNIAYPINDPVQPGHIYKIEFVVGYDVFCFTGISKFLMEKLFVAGD